MSVPTHHGRLFDFAAQGKAEELRQLLANGTIGSIKVLDSKGRTALNIAVSEEHLDVVQVIRGAGDRAEEAGWKLTCLALPDPPSHARRSC